MITVKAPALTKEQLEELETSSKYSTRVGNGPHICGRAYPVLAAYNYGILDGDIDYRVTCYGCHMQTFGCQTPQEAYDVWYNHYIQALIYGAALVQ